MYDISTMHTVDTEKGDAHINVLPAKLKKTTLQTKDRIDKLKIKKQKQDFRVNGSCSLS